MHVLGHRSRLFAPSQEKSAHVYICLVDPFVWSESRLWANIIYYTSAHFNLTMGIRWVKGNAQLIVWNLFWVCEDSLKILCP